MQTHTYCILAEKLLKTHQLHTVALADMFLHYNEHKGASIRAFQPPAQLNLPSAAEFKRQIIKNNASNNGNRTTQKMTAQNIWPKARA